MFDNLKKLCELNATSGREQNVRDYIVNEIDGFCEFSVDPIGNIICFKKGKNRAAKKIMLDAHMDEVGFMVTSITEDGFLKFATVGGVDVSVIVAKNVQFLSGVKGVVTTKPIHLCDADERAKMPNLEHLVIDIGAENRQQAEAVVSVGDPFTFSANYVTMGDCVATKAIDDRVGCAILIDIIKKFDEFDFYATFSVMEEVGLRGAKVATYTVDPESAIVLEATTAADLPTVGSDKMVCNLKSGAVLSFMDNATVYDLEYFNLGLACAKQNGINVQVKKAVAGGNNSGAVHCSRGGVKTVAISVPCRYIHSGMSVANFDDIVAVRQLAEKMLEAIAKG